MGCVFGREVASLSEPSSFNEERGSREFHLGSRRRERVVVHSLVKEEDSNIDGTKIEVSAKDNAKQLTQRIFKLNPRSSNPRNSVHGEQVAAGWPHWLVEVAGEAIRGLTPRRADTFEKLNKIGQGTYSNVYKARDTVTGQIVALKKVRFDNLEPESVKFMAREIIILRHLDHPNVVKLQGIAMSRMTCSLYLVFDYMDHDLAGLASSPGIEFTESQVKCYIRQLLSGLEHCHERLVLHRDIKGSNLLIDGRGVLKIADFGLASFFDPSKNRPMTSRVVTLWYRAPELLLGSTNYGPGIDLWSVGCILAELLDGKPVMTGRTEVEQLHKIFKLCGSPKDEYWKKLKLPHATLFRPQQAYKRCVSERFKDFPKSSLSLIETLLAIDPSERLTASAALSSEFFTTKPYACDPSSLPKYPPCKEMDALRRDEDSTRMVIDNKARNYGVRKTTRTRDRAMMRRIPVREANHDLSQADINNLRRITRSNAKCKSEKFPPPHEDGGLIGYPLGSSNHFNPVFEPLDDDPLNRSMVFSRSKEPKVRMWSGPLAHRAEASRTSIN